MWLFTSKAFLSVVQHKTDPSVLIVRSRRPGHIQDLFPGVKTVTLDYRDYQYRAELPREVVAERMAQYVREMAYTNFKDSVTENVYHNACFKVWDAMANIQPKAPYACYSGRNQPRQYGFGDIDLLPARGGSKKRK